MEELNKSKVSQRLKDEVKELTGSTPEAKYGTADKNFAILSEVPAKMRAGGMKELSITSQGKVTFTFEGDEIYTMQV